MGDFGVEPQPKHAIANCSQTVSPIPCPPGDYKRGIGWTCHSDSAFCQITMVLDSICIKLLGWSSRVSKRSKRYSALMLRDIFFDPHVVCIDRITRLARPTVCLSVCLSVVTDCYHENETRQKKTKLVWPFPRTRATSAPTISSIGPRLRSPDVEK